MQSYFEGLYFKQQNKGETVALIPALHIDSRGTKSASIQIITNQEAYNLPCSGRDIALNRRKNQVVVGKNRFSPSGIALDVDTPQVKAHGTLCFEGITPLSYDIMGPFAMVPFMECRHKVVSVRHRVEGELIVNNRRYAFHDGIGYIEGDRGHSFPSQYLWTQCASQTPSCSVMLSVAEIPMLVGRFTGVIGVVKMGNREYRLATYRGVRIVEASSRRLVLRQGRYLLEASFAAREAHPLRAPRTDGMTRTIRECNRARARFRFWEGGGLVFDLCSENASLECEEAVPDGAKRRGALL